MFVVGLVDDVLALKPATKLIAQIALASVLLFFGYRLNWLESRLLDSLLTLVWVVGLTNAFNLLDNMDGLCAGIALIVGDHRWCSGCSTGVTRDLGAPAEVRVPGAPDRRDRRVPRLQLSAGLDLHGRQRQPAARLQPRRR